MPEAVVTSLDISAIINGVVAALLTIVAFFLSRSLRALDRLDERMGEAEKRLSVHGEKHVSHENRLADLEDGG